MSIDLQAAQVKAFRQKLLDSGHFVHAAVGEIRSGDKKVWVATSYSGGEFEVTCWLRPGSVNDYSTRFVVRPVARDADLDKLAADLIDAASSGEVLDGAWPPVGTGGIRGTL